MLRLVFDIKNDNGTWSAAMQSPDQAQQWFPATSITVQGDSLRMDFAPLSASCRGVLADDQIRGEFTQGRPMPLDLVRGEIAMNRPQTPQPPYPYSAEDVAFSNGGIELAGTLTTPRGSVKKVAVLVSGSGPQNRDEELFGHRPFAVIADHLTRQGIAVLRYDDRDVGKSTGVNSGTVSDFATDAIAAVEYASKRFPKASVGIIGHSEGGMIAIMTAAQGVPDFIVSLAGLATSGRTLLARQQADIMRASGTPEEFIAPFQQTMQKATDTAMALENPDEIHAAVAAIFAGTPLAPQTDAMAATFSMPEIRSIVLYDPAEYFPRVKCPVLALNGEKDLQVACEPNLAAFRAGVPNAVVKSFPGLNHIFQHTETGLPTEYGVIEETFSPDALTEISQWILALPRNK